jgi:DNA-binding CsgD family transcriptional regulator
VTRGNDDAVEKLTEAQREALRLVMAGYQSKEIARELGIGVDAVNKRLAAAKTVLGASTRFAAARQLTAFEAREGSHSLVSHSLAVEADAIAGPPFAPSTDEGWGDEQPRRDHRVQETGGEYVVSGHAADLRNAAADRGAVVSNGAFGARLLFATPLRVFLITLVIGSIGALFLRS